MRCSQLMLGVCSGYSLAVLLLLTKEGTLRVGAMGSGRIAAGLGPSGLPPGLSDRPRCWRPQPGAQLWRGRLGLGLGSGPVLGLPGSSCPLSLPSDIVFKPRVAIPDAPP